MNMGYEHPVSEHGLLTTICCDAHGKPAYALEGSVFIAAVCDRKIMPDPAFYAQSLQESFKELLNAV